MAKRMDPTSDLSVSLDETHTIDNASPQVLNQCQIDFGLEDSPRDWHVELDLFVDDFESSAGIVTEKPLQPKVNSAKAQLQIMQ